MSARTARLPSFTTGSSRTSAELRHELTIAGVRLTSETDTEVVAHLLAAYLPESNGDLAEALRRTCRRLDGAFTLVCVDRTQPDVVVAARRNSPLVVGIGDGENFLASDVAAFVDHTRDALELGQDQVVAITADSVIVTDFAGEIVEPAPFHVDWDASAAEKGGYDLFMLKEIAEQPKAVADSLRGRVTKQHRIQLDEMHLDEGILRSINKVIVIACGTAAYAGMVARSTPSSTGPGCRWRSSWRASSATATRSSDPTAWSSRSRSPGRRWTR